MRLSFILEVLFFLVWGISKCLSYSLYFPPPDPFIADGCPLEGSDQVDVSHATMPSSVFWSEILNHVTDGMHTGQYTFDLFTYFHMTLDSPGWFVCLSFSKKKTPLDATRQSWIQNVLTIFFFLSCRIDAILKLHYPPYTVTIFSFFFSTFLVVFHGIHNKQKSKNSNVFRLLGPLPTCPTGPPINATKQW